MKRSIRIETLETTDPDRAIHMELYYKEGGVNMFAGTIEPRGYYISAHPIKRENGMELATAFSGTCSMVESTTRFNQKKLDTLATIIKENPLYKDVLNAVIGKSKLILKEQS